MLRRLLISVKDGRALRTYGVKKVQVHDMKFSFIICVVIAIAWCECIWAEARIFNDLKYLEYLNDLDRRNVEMEYEMHKQWPFHVFKNTDGIDRNEVDDKSENPDNLMKIQEIVNMAREQMANRHQHLLDKFEHGFKHFRDTTDRANQLSQYLRYSSPSAQERLEEVRMYPQEDDFTFNEENDNDNKFYRDNNDFILNDEEVAENERNSVNPETIYPQSQSIGLTLNREVEANKDEPVEDMHHSHEDYKFKEGEEFPHTIKFNEIPLADDPSEFGVGPSDSRFFRNIPQTDDDVTLTPRSDISGINNLKLQQMMQPKVFARSEQLQEPESFPVNHGRTESTEKDVEVVPFKPDMSQTDSAGVYIIAVVAGISAAATVGLIAVGIGWYNLQKHMKNAEDTDYPSYGIVGPNKDYEKKDRDDAGDRRLAQSAQMYHYQHQKQQIIAMGRNPQGGHGSQSDTEEEEDEEGNYTVYECPGLASIEGPLEVKNPMFDDDQLATPSQTPSKPTNAEDTK